MRLEAGLRSSPDTNAKPTPVPATATAEPSIASSMPPSAKRTGNVTAAIVPPSGTAVWRTPSAQPRRVAG